MQPHIILLTLVGLAFIPEVIWISRLFRDKVSDARLPRITLRINIVVAFLGTLLVAGSVLYDVNYLNYEAPIPYSHWQNIKWSDFRGIKRPNQTLQGSLNFAFVSTQIRIEKSDGQLVVTTYFHPARSYTFSQEAADQDLMTHELYHLHITEYFARQIRQSFSFSDYDVAVSFAHRAMIDEQYMQDDYDMETGHGYALGIQRKWQKKVDSLLNSLSEYSSPVVNLKQ